MGIRHSVKAKKLFREGWRGGFRLAGDSFRSGILRSGSGPHASANAQSFDRTFSAIGLSHVRFHKLDALGQRRTSFVARLELVLGHRAPYKSGRCDSRHLASGKVFCNHSTAAAKRPGDTLQSLRMQVGPKLLLGPAATAVSASRLSAGKSSAGGGRIRQSFAMRSAMTESAVPEIDAG